MIPTIHNQSGYKLRGYVTEIKSGGLSVYSLVVVTTGTDTSTVWIAKEYASCLKLHDHINLIVKKDSDGKLVAFPKEFVT